MERHEAIDIALETAISLEENGHVRASLAIYLLCAGFGDLTATCKVADVLSDYEEFKNLNEAQRLYKQACLAGYQPACYNLGVLLDQLGRSAEAQKLYERAPDLKE